MGSRARLLKDCNPARTARLYGRASERPNGGMVIRNDVAHATRGDLRVISGGHLDRPERVHTCRATGIDSKWTIRRGLDARMATGPDGRFLEGVHRHLISCDNGGTILNDDPRPFRCGHGHLAARQHVPLTRDVHDGLLLGGYECGACHTNASSLTGHDLVAAGDHEGTVAATHRHAHPLRRRREGAVQFRLVEDVRRLHDSSFRQTAALVNVAAYPGRARACQSWPGGLCLRPRLTGTPSASYTNRLCRTGGPISLDNREIAPTVAGPAVRRHRAPDYPSPRRSRST